MKKYITLQHTILTIFSLLSFYNAECQQYLTPVQNGNSVLFSMNIPIDRPPYRTPDDYYYYENDLRIGKPRTDFFIEYGDGSFSTNPNATKTYLKDGANEFRYVARGKYDGGHPTARSTSCCILNSSNTANQNISVNNPSLLTNTEKLRIISDVSDIIEDDETILVLTYKVPDNLSNIKLLFLYNDKITASNKPNVFDVIPVGYSALSNSKTFVRSHFSETEISFNTLNSSSYLNDYNNYLSWNVINDQENISDQPSSLEHNIFISLISKEDLSSLDGQMANFKLLLISDSSVIEDITYQLPVFINRPHDPNYLTQNSVCMQFPKEGKEINYTIHFQNDGVGTAKNIKVKAILPQGINATNIYDVKALIGGTEKSMIIYYNGNTTEFTFNNANLAGTFNLPYPAVDPRTMGEISFKIKTTDKVQDVLQSYASIVFDKNEPIITDIAESYFTYDCNKKSKSKNENIWKATVSPNPVNNRSLVWVKRPIDVKGLVTGMLFNSQGILVQQFSFYDQTYISGNKIPAGVYFLKLKTNNTVIQTLKVIIGH